MTSPSEYSAANTKPVNRFTSEHVLTVGVEQGWADPVDPRAVDYSERPSILGEYTFDEEGRPINPNATPEMSGDRGELGKWGVNLAEEVIAIAIGPPTKRHPRGKRSILLVRRADTGQWSLPGGMVDPGEGVSVTAKRELKEEAGIDLTTTPSRHIYHMYANDPRNGLNAWIETRGSLVITHHTPRPTIDHKEITGAQWFELYDDVETLEWVAGPLYASHADGVRIALAELQRFDNTMTRAQEAHGRGDHQQALCLWRTAEQITPDPFEKARAIRGNAASLHRLGGLASAVQKARQAFDIHNSAVAAFPEVAIKEALRERAESANVLGRIMLSSTVEREKSGLLTPAEAFQEAQEGLVYLNNSLMDITRVETGETIDQYRINLLSRMALANSLYGSVSGAKEYARQAANLGWFSEAKDNPSSANISTAHRWLARARAVSRGYAALIVENLITSQGLRRKAALAITSNKYFGL